MDVRRNFAFLIYCGLCGRGDFLRSGRGEAYRRSEDADHDRGGVDFVARMFCGMVFVVAYPEKTL